MTNFQKPPPPKHQSWAQRSLKSLNRSSLLSEPRFWEQMSNLRKRAKSDKRTDKIQILSGSLKSDKRKKERRHSKSDFKDRTVKMVEKRIKQ